MTMHMTNRVDGMSDTKRQALRKLLEQRDLGDAQILDVFGSTMKVIRPGSLKLFIFPATDGSVGYMHNYLPHVPQRWGVYALQTPGIDGERQPYRTVEEIAADGIRQIRLAQPKGPYRIAGNCMGGLPAHEAARQLQEQGEEVTLLLHLMPNFNRPWTELPTSTDQLQLRAVIDYVYIIQRLLKVTIDMPLDDIAALNSAEQVDAVVQYIRARGWLADFDEDVFRRRMAIYRANLEAMLTYDPPATFRGDITVLAVGDATQGEHALYTDSPYISPLRCSVSASQNDCSTLASGIKPVFVDADGGALFDGSEPDISRIGAELRKILESVE